MSETERPAHYWRSMYEDQVRRKRLLHERYDRLHRAAREVFDGAGQGDDEALGVALVGLGLALSPKLMGNGEAEAERDFLVARMVDRRDGVSWVGISSDAMTVAAITAQRVREVDWPRDRGDLWRCEETYRRAPAHLQARMLPILERFRAHVGKRYPERTAPCATITKGET